MSDPFGTGDPCVICYNVEHRHAAYSTAQRRRGGRDSDGTSLKDHCAPSNTSAWRVLECTSVADGHAMRLWQEADDLALRQSAMANAAVPCGVRAAIDGLQSLNMLMHADRTRWRKKGAPYATRFAARTRQNECHESICCDRGKRAWCEAVPRIPDVFGHHHPVNRQIQDDERENGTGQTDTRASYSDAMNDVLHVVPICYNVEHRITQHASGSRRNHCAPSNDSCGEL